MQEDVKMIMDELTAQSQKSLDHVISEVRKLRAGKAMPSMLDSVQVEYYGAKTLMVKPWEKSMLEEIERGIMYANLGLNPQNDGEQVIINVPPLTEERRLQIVKQAKAESEHGKIGLRSARKDALDMVKSLQKDGLSEDMAKDAEAKVQEIIDAFSKKIDDVIAAKETEILTI